MADNEIDIIVRLKNFFSKESNTVNKDIGNIGNASAKTSKDVDTLSTSTNNFQGALKKVITGGALLAIAKGLFEIGKNALTAASDWETMQTSFKVLLGSADKANKLLAEIKQTASTTPFTLTGLADASKTLLSFGITQEKIIPTMRMLGDVSGGSGDKLKSLTLAYAQVQSTGRLMGQDLLQMINQGFNPLQIISQKTGKSMAVLKKEMEKGAISALDVAEAFKIATSEGGLFYQGMEEQSKTFAGRLSTLQDGFDDVMRSIGDRLLPIGKLFVNFLIGLVDKFNGLSEGMKSFIVVAGAVTLVITGLVGGVMVLAAAVAALGITINIAFLGIPLLIGAVVASIYVLTKAIQDAGGVSNYFRNSIISIGQALINIVTNPIKKFLESLQWILEAINKVSGGKINFSVKDAINNLNALDDKLEQYKVKNQDILHLTKNLTKENQNLESSISNLKSQMAQLESQGKKNSSEYIKLSIELDNTNEKLNKNRENINKNTIALEKETSAIENKINAQKKDVEVARKSGNKEDLIKELEELEKFEREKLEIKKIYSDAELALEGSLNEELNSVRDERSALDAEKRAQEISEIQAKYDAEGRMLEKFIADKAKWNKKDAEDFAKWQSFMIQAARSKNQEVAAIAKGLAIYDIGIKTYQAAMGGYLSLVGIPIIGPVLAIGAAAAAVAFGAEQAQAVASQQPSFASGGVVGGFQGATAGGDNTTANVRSGEMLLNADEQKELFDVAQGGGTGGDLTVNLTVDGDVLTNVVIKNYNNSRNLNTIERISTS